MKVLNQKSLFCLLLAALLASQTAFAESERMLRVYQTVDSAFARKSDAELHMLLAENRDDAEYRLLESYVIRKIRRLITERDYRLAMLADLAVLDNNLANEEAVELYSAIISAQEQQKALKAAVAGQLEGDEDGEEADTEAHVAETDGEMTAAAAVASPERKPAWRYFWLFKFGMLDGLFFTVTDKKSSRTYDSLRYGISADLLYEQAFQMLRVGVEFSSAAVIVPFSNGDGALIGNVNVVPTFGFPAFNEYVQARAGFACFIKKETTSPSLLHKTIYTPVIGCGFTRIPVGNAQLSGSVDYYPGHFAYSDLYAAFGGAFNCRIPLSTLERIRLNFNIAAKDSLFIKTDGIENRACLTLAIGIGSRTP